MVRDGRAREEEGARRRLRYSFPRARRVSRAHRDGRRRRRSSARASDDDDGTSRGDVRDVRGGAEQVHVSSMRDEDVRIGVRAKT